MATYALDTTFGWGQPDFFEAENIAEAQQYGEAELDCVIEQTNLTGFAVEFQIYEVNPVTKAQLPEAEVLEFRRYISTVTETVDLYGEDGITIYLNGTYSLCDAEDPYAQVKVIGRDLYVTSLQQAKELIREAYLDLKGIEDPYTPTYIDEEAA